VGPELAESYEISEDGMSATFHLRPNIYWHDGTPFTSADVKFTYDAILDPQTGSTFHGDFSAAVKAVETPDDYTVVLRLNKPTPEILSLVGTYGAMIIPKHVLEDIPHAELRTCKYNTEAPPPGLGPMKFVKWEHGKYVEYEAYDNYYLGRPFVDHLFQVYIPEPTTALAALEAHNVDMLYSYISDSLTSEIKRLQSERPDINASTYTAFNSIMIPMNNEHPILNNKYVRKAIAHMIPYEDIIESIYYGLAIRSNGIPPPVTWGWNPNTPYYDYDPEKAKEYLKMAGFPEWPPAPAVVETPLTTYLLPAATLVVGLVVGSLGSYLALKRKATKA
jgi:peptide/nickel transport system substrate-binding protein